MTEHNQLKKYAKQVLRQLGFEDTEIQEEYYVNFDGMREKLLVDVVGISEHRKIAIECGKTPSTKTIKLQMYFDEVILLPYFKSKVSDQFALPEKEMALKLTRQKNNINNLERKLEKQKNEYEEEIKNLKDKVDFVENNIRSRKKILGAIILFYLQNIGCLPIDFSIEWMTPTFRSEIISYLKSMGDYVKNIDKRLAYERQIAKENIRKIGDSL